MADSDWLFIVLAFAIATFGVRGLCVYVKHRIDCRRRDQLEAWQRRMMLDDEPRSATNSSNPQT